MPVSNWEAPLGFRFAATYAGIRKEKKPDLALIVSDLPAETAAMFTKNRLQAAPVIVGKQHLRESGSIVRAVLVNAGNANCATGNGERVATQCCRELARRLQIPVTQVIPCSTGVIGVELDGRKIIEALPSLISELSPDRALDVAEAIMTTDTVPKLAWRQLAVGNGEKINLLGITKGAGMIHPQMATTLAFVLTDAVVPARQLQSMLRRAVDLSYHCLSVDGDTSTNDTVLLLANGASGIRLQGPRRVAFEQLLVDLMQELAKKIARDGEGASKFVEIKVHGATNDRVAREIGRAVANSNLVKTAIAGADPNWGRILSAIGNAPVAVDPNRVRIWIQQVEVCRYGKAVKFDESKLVQLLSSPEVAILIEIEGDGNGQATFWTCDLTEEYVRINAEYRT